VVPGPRTSNVSKAARCCVDWAIQEYGAVETGQASAVATAAARVTTAEAEGTGAPASGYLTYEEVAKHSTPEDLWVIIGDEVYDLTDVSFHPGGAKPLLKYAGRDSTTEFLDAHPLSIIKQALPDAAKKFKGKIKPEDIPPEGKVPHAEAAGGAEEGVAITKVPEGEVDVPPLEACINVFDFESVARKRMALTGKKEAWDYYASGADDEVTLRENHNAFQRIFLKPRCLVNVSSVDTSTTILGCPVSFPLYLSAVAVQKKGHKDGELNWVRAANEQDVIFMAPTLASCSFEEIANEARIVGTTLFFQLYVNPNRCVLLLRRRRRRRPQQRWRLHCPPPLKRCFALRLPAS
jgi:L-lactate dehydrogenase (cytochrome)